MLSFSVRSVASKTRSASTKSNNQSLLRLSGQIHTKLHQNGRPGKYPRKHCQFFQIKKWF